MRTDPLLLGALLLFLLATYLFFRLRRKNLAPRPRPDPRPTASKERAAPAADTVADAPPAIPSPFRATADGPADDLTEIKGIGPKLSALLAGLGVYTFRQIADWTPEQLALVDRSLGQFSGRASRDQWQQQARLLADGDRRAFERLHGKLAESAPPASPPPASPDPERNG